ncbi:MAG TPA: hypothetical protein VFN88_00300, partial [Caulobacteraceae bacterium]|nr:hypothetical protein [Caulobacteraceae bacterium]
MLRRPPPAWTSAAPERGMKLGRALFFIGFAVVATGGYFAYRWLTFEQPPGFSELPESWFARPATADPADWRMAGLAEVKVETPSGANLQVIPEDRSDIQASLAGPQGSKPYPLVSGSMVIASDVKLPCPARPTPDAPTLVLRTPRSVVVRAKGRFAGQIGPAQNLIIDADGCSRWTIASARTLWLAER